MTRVKNVSGSSRFAVPNGYSSWLDYWEKQTGTKNILVVPVGVVTVIWLVPTFRKQTAVTRVGILPHSAKLVIRERMSLMCSGILFPFHRIFKMSLCSLP